MVAAPFFFMLFAVMELGVIFTTESVLQGAMMDSGRLVRTGRADNEGIDESEFKEELCSRMSIFQSDCLTRAHIDIRPIPQFRNPDLPNPVQDGKAFDEDKTDYLIGQPGDLILVRVWYQQPVVTPFLSQALTKLDNGTIVMTATTAFRNEPFNPVAGGGGNTP